MSEVAELSPKYLMEADSNVVPIGYKQTDVGAIPEDWDVSPLSRMTSLMTNGFVGTAKTHYTDSHDGVTYIQGYNVEENSFNFNGIKRVTPEFHKKNSKSCLREGDVLMVQTGDVGLVTIVPQELEGANCHALIISRFKKEIYDPLYFSYYLNSQQGRLRLKELETGTTMKHINVGDLLHFEVPYPRAKKEQTAIANALSDVDALISELEKLIAKKQAIKTATMQQLLTGRTRLPQFALRDNGTPKGTKPSELGEIPEDWEIYSLGQLIKGTQLGGNYKNSEQETGQPLIKMGNLGRGYIKLDKLEFVVGKAKEVDRLEFGDLLFNTRNTLDLVGKVSVWRNELSVAFFNSNLMRITFDPALIGSNFYMNAVMNSNGFVNALSDIAIGTTSVAAIYSRDLFQLKVSLPPKEEQAAIATILSDMDAEIQALEQRLGKTRQIKQGMMQELLTGKTRLIKPAKEVIHE
jgi:type I restriction enzyme, S subunit